MRDLNRKLDIVVVGGSLAALFAAVPLVRLGHNVTILERAQTPLLHDQSAGLVAGGNTQAFYARHDRSQRDIGVVSKTRLYLDRKGQVIDREDYEQRMTSWDLLYCLLRGNFDAVDSKYLDMDKVKKAKGPGEGIARYEYGRLVTAIKDKGEKIVVEFQDTRERAEQESSNSARNSGVIEADYLIAADGPSSHTRPMLLGDTSSQRKYVGYVAFRGMVPESQLSDAASAVFVDMFSFFHTDGSQVLAYTIPGVDGTLERGKRMVNWAWYWNYPEDSADYAELMTDVDGKRHRFTVPTGGKMRKDVWQKQIEKAKEHLPPQYAEVIAKTTSPFVQAITDVEPPAQGTKVGRLLNGKATLVGDALAGFRPHTAAGTSQAAFNALLLEKVFKGELEWTEYEEKVLEFAWHWQRRGVMLGTRSQFGRHPLANQGPANGQAVNREELHMRKMASRK